jgi:hypothetical protein
MDWTGLAGSNIAGKAFTLALEDAGRNFIAGFTREPEIKSWLITRGVHVSRDRAPPYRPTAEAQSVGPGSGQGNQAAEHLRPAFGQSEPLYIAGAVRRIDSDHRADLHGTEGS